MLTHKMYSDSRPWTRWWWFSGEILEADIRYQLDWLKANHFGGVELAFVYPLPDARPGPHFLSADWSRLLAFTKQHCDAIGLGCDFTFGTLWPFGGTFVDAADASKTYQGLSPQRLNKSWEKAYTPEPGYILDHLSHTALERYSEKVGAAMQEALKGSTSALFCDSWEVSPEGLWGDGFGEAFEKKFGYELLPYMPELDDHADVRYDYRKLISEFVLREFYAPYTDLVNSLNAMARVQCHGAPCDILAAYALADIPESEAILFDPEFSTVAASAAVLANKPVVSCETFTCLYGWKSSPEKSPHLKAEKLADLKLLADALFANGVNHIIWHGMPYNPKGGNNEFYASVHVGPDAAFAAELPAFNAYMEQVSVSMKKGLSYTDVAVYLPLEDQWMLNKLPESQYKPSAMYHWELQYLRFPQELEGYHPTWISGHFLKDAQVINQQLHYGQGCFSLLYVDAEWMDMESLERLHLFASQGLPVFCRHVLRQPGKEQSRNYEQTLRQLLQLKNVSRDISALQELKPLVAGRHLPDFWCRCEAELYHFFFAHPAAKALRYPMEYGRGEEAAVEAHIPVHLHVFGHEVTLDLHFKPGQSLLFTVDREGCVNFVRGLWKPE